MANRGPSFTLQALVRTKDAANKESVQWITIGAVWATKERGLHTGRINAMPLAWLELVLHGSGPVLDIAIREMEERR